MPNRRRFLQSLLSSLAIPAFYHPLSHADMHNADSNQHVRMLGKDETDYAKHRQIFNKRITAMPRIIAVCYDEAGVQQAMRYANELDLPVSIKSGGHSFEGLSLNDDGFLIDLSLMNAMQYDADTTHMVIQPGAKLGATYEYLAQFNRLIPAGSCAGVGVGGLTLGGGYGFFSREHGLTCDSLISITMVDGKGELHNSDDEPELLWACRGGNNGNLGVVTSMTFATHPTPAHFTSYRFKARNLTPQRAKSLAKDWFKLMEDLPETGYSSWVMNRKTLTVLLTDTTDAPNPAMQTIIAALKASADETKAVRKDAFLRGVQRFRGGTDPMYFKNVSAGYYKNFNDIDAVFESIAAQIQSQRFTTLLQINTLGGKIADKDLQKTAAYPHRCQPFLGELQIYYNRASQGGGAVQTVQRIQAELTAAGIDRHYRNYPDIDLPDYQKAYYGSSLQRLQTLKATYDPDNRIRHAQSIRA